MYTKIKKNKLFDIKISIIENVNLSLMMPDGIYCSRYSIYKYIYF